MAIRRRDESLDVRTATLPTALEEVRRVVGETLVDIVPMKSAASGG